MRYYLYILIGVLILGYLLWAVIRIRKENKRKEVQLGRTIYMYDVQKTLFDAHKKPELITEALSKVSDMLGAEYTFLLSLDGTYVEEVYACPEDDAGITAYLSGKMLGDFLPQTSARLLREENMLYYKENGAEGLDRQDYDTLERFGANSLMLVPILNSRQQLRCVLGGANMKKKWSDVGLIECVAGNFMMALNNIRSYRKIEEMGTIDALTTLKNRNSYQQAMNQYARKDNPAFGCIYMDVNGLHELNNHLGHAAGDRMLIYIARSLKEVFGGGDTYRVGGDEFVIFCRDAGEDMIQEKIRAFQQKLQKEGYHVSIGTAWQDATLHIEHLISEAEHRMYEDKRHYYESKGDVTKTRELNRKLEKILQEKKDVDTFLSIISSYFMGVYVVDMKKDETRLIYRPSYFATILERTNNKFAEAMRIYTEEFVCEEESADFLRFIDYKEVEQRLKTERSLEYLYRKKDNTRVIVRISKSGDYSDMNRETFWVFEEYTGRNV